MNHKDIPSFDIIDLVNFPQAGENNDIKTLEQQEAERFGKDTKLRATLAIWTMIIISFWLVSVLLIIVFKSNLETKITITLLATTTLNVLGLPKIILEGLFKNHPRKAKRN